MFRNAGYMTPLARNPLRWCAMTPRYPGPRGEGARSRCWHRAGLGFFALAIPPPSHFLNPACLWLAARTPCGVLWGRQINASYRRQLFFALLTAVSAREGRLRVVDLLAADVAFDLPGFWTGSEVRSVGAAA